MSTSRKSPGSPHRKSPGSPVSVVTRLVENTRCAWDGGTFLRCLRKVPQAHSHSACLLQELGWKHKQTISNFVQVFWLNPNLLLAHRNRYSEGMDDGQKTPHGHPDFNSYVKNLCVLVFITDGWTDRDIHPLCTHSCSACVLQELGWKYT